MQIDIDEEPESLMERNKWQPRRLIRNGSNESQPGKSTRVNVDPTGKQPFGLELTMPFIHDFARSSDAEIGPETKVSSPEIQETTLQISRESLVYLRDKYVHFLSADCVPTTSVSKLLVAIGAIDLEELKEKKPRTGQVLVISRDKFKVYTVILKKRHSDNLTPERLEVVLQNLLVILKADKVKQFRITRFGDLCDSLPRNVLMDSLTNICGNAGIDIVVCHGKVEILPPELRPRIIAEYHESLIGGHKGVTKTYRRIRKRYTWPNLREEITEHIRRCRSCPQRKIVRAQTREPMLITDTPLDTFDKVSIDTVGKLPVTPDGNCHVLTIQDNLSKYSIYVAIPDISATTIAHALATNLFTVYGAPKCILTDRGKAFTSTLMRKLAKIFNITRVTTSGYRSQTNRALERSHAVLAEYIKHYASAYDDWDRLLPYAM